jgi:hypothetical protein
VFERIAEGSACVAKASGDAVDGGGDGAVELGRDGLAGVGAPLGLADRAEQTGLGEELACELVQAGGGGEAGRVGQSCVLGRAIKLGSHSAHRCVNATAFPRIHLIGDHF